MACYPDQNPTTKEGEAEVVILLYQILGYLDIPKSSK
jgi:hypothetical protein